MEDLFFKARIPENNGNGLQLFTRVPIYFVGIPEINRNLFIYELRKY